jgi:hypothetical protein
MSQLPHRCGALSRNQAQVDIYFVEITDAYVAWNHNDLGLLSQGQRLTSAIYQQHHISTAQHTITIDDT